MTVMCLGLGFVTVAAIGVAFVAAPGRTEVREAVMWAGLVIGLGASEIDDRYCEPAWSGAAQVESLVRLVWDVVEVER
jgi:hypothetical protein